MPKILITPSSLPLTSYETLSINGLLSSSGHLSPTTQWNNISILLTFWTLFQFKFGTVTWIDLKMTKNANSNF